MPGSSRPGHRASVSEPSVAFLLRRVLLPSRQCCPDVHQRITKQVEAVPLVRIQGARIVCASPIAHIRSTGLASTSTRLLVPRRNSWRSWCWENLAMLPATTTRERRSPDHDAQSSRPPQLHRAGAGIERSRLEVLDMSARRRAWIIRRSVGDQVWCVSARYQQTGRRGAVVVAGGPVAVPRTEKSVAMDRWRDGTVIAYLPGKGVRQRRAKTT
jgi:hypothetical protein